jgi:hypothetical protein
MIVGWKPCNRMLTLKGARDPPHWCDSRGEEIGESMVDHIIAGSWEPIVDGRTKTDSHGWTYAFDFDGLDTPRNGGRGEMRSTDCVRRRCWAKRGVGTTVQRPAIQKSTVRGVVGDAVGVLAGGLEAMTPALLTSSKEPVSSLSADDGRLIFIGDRLITMGFPDEHMLPRLSEQLKQQFGGHFMVWNLSEVKYDYEAFENQVSVLRYFVVSISYVTALFLGCKRAHIDSSY